MTRATADWEKLLDGTTPAPWYPMRHGDEFSIVHINPGRAPAEGFVGDVYGEENAHLAAATPEAIAEVIRLRQELEQIRRECLASAKASEGNARTSNSWEALEAVAYMERDTAESITRILEGDTK